MRPIRFVAALEWKVKVSVGADVLGGPQPRSNENHVVGRLRAAMVFDSPPLPGEGIEGLWGKDIGSFIRKSSDALLLRCSDAEVGQDRGVDLLTEYVLCAANKQIWYNSVC